MGLGIGIWGTISNKCVCEPECVGAALMLVLEEGKVKYGEVVKGNKHMVLVHFINSQQVYKKYRYRPCDRCDGQENKDMRTDEQSWGGGL